MNVKVRRIALYGMLVISASMLLQVDDRKQPDIPTSPYSFDNMHISPGVVSSGTVAGSTTVYGISGYGLVIQTKR